MSIRLWRSDHNEPEGVKRPNISWEHGVACEKCSWGVLKSKKIDGDTWLECPYCGHVIKDN